MKYYKYILSIFCCLLIAACGSTSGGGVGADNITSAEVTLSDTKIETIIEGETQVITATIHCSSDDIFSKECVFHGVDVSWGDSHKITYTYNDIIRVGESKEYEILVFSASDKIHEPFSYMYNSNPSTSYTGWTTYEDVVGTLESTMIAVGREVCVEDPPPPVTQELQTQSTTCTGITSFSAALPDYTKGTLRITDGGQVLEEKSFGILSGNGSGYIVDNHADFTFNKAPSVGAFITAMYISPFKELSNMPVGDDMTVFYGTDQFTKEGDLIIDSMLQVMGNITGKEIIVTNPWGFRESAVTVRYDGEPFVSNGGETVGAGDGILKTFSLKTKYAPVYEDLIKVFTDTQQGELILFDKNTGEFTVEFPQPPIEGEEIKTSYSLSTLTMPVTLSFNVNGTHDRTVILEVTR